jgi:asparagine N-glycosylation enzyme membrane subunit Stt3
MIQVTDSGELKGKATKGSLADVAEKEADRLSKQLLWYVLACIPLVVLEFFLRKAGWFVLPTIMVVAFLFKRTGDKVTELRGRSATYKKLKTIHPKRDSYR